MALQSVPLNVLVPLNFIVPVPALLVSNAPVELEDKPLTLKLDTLNSTSLAKADLLMVILHKSVVPPVPVMVWLALPVKVMPAPPVFVLKSSMPLLVKLPAIERTCVVTVPALFERNVPPAFIVVFPVTVKVLAVVCSNCRMPLVPPPMVRLFTVAFWSMLTVAPLTIVTLSPFGTTPPTQVEAELQLPPLAVEEIFAGTEDIREISSTDDGVVPTEPSQ